MDKDTLLELDEIRMRLSDGIGAISVIVDGLSYYTCGSNLSGENAMRYVKTLSTIFDTLSDIVGEFEAELDAVKSAPREGSGAA